MDWLYQILLWLANAEIFNGSSNILGLIWLLLLMWIMYNRFKPQFREMFPKKYETKLWYFALILITFCTVFLMQMMIDDLIQTPIDLIFGSWQLKAAQMGAFSLYNLLLLKWDVYSMILIYSLGFSTIGVWHFFHFDKKSGILLAAVILWIAMVAQTHYWSHLRFDGWMRIQVYWLTYPEFRILTGFFIGTIVKKKKGISDEKSIVDISQ